MHVPYDTRSWLNKTRSEARRHGVPFELEEDDIQLLLDSTPRCPVTDIPLFNTRGQGGGPNTPNLVRLVAHKGFTPTNIVVLSRKARSMRQNASPTELRRLADLIEESERKNSDDGPVRGS